MNNKNLQEFEGERAPDTMATIIGVVFLGYVVWASSGCVAVIGTPEGIRAYGDYQVGTQKTAKEGADSENQYFKMREKSFWQKLTETPSETQGL